MDFIKLLKLYAVTFKWLEPYLQDLIPQPTYDHNMNKEEIYETAKASLGMDASPGDIVPDNVGCAETISTIIRRAIPYLNFPLLVSTRSLFDYLSNSEYFFEIKEPDFGDIIISVTGTGNGKVSHGHCGIVAKYGILSNDSRSGLFLENYSLQSWKLYFQGKGGFPTHYFRAK